MHGERLLPSSCCSRSAISSLQAGRTWLPCVFLWGQAHPAKWGKDSREMLVRSTQKKRKNSNYYVTMFYWLFDWRSGGIILKTSQLTDKLSNHHATYPHKSTLFFTPQTKTRARSSCTRSLLSAQGWFVLNLFTIGGISTWIQYNSESNQMSCRP